MIVYNLRCCYNLKRKLHQLNFFVCFKKNVLLCVDLFIINKNKRNKNERYNFSRRFGYTFVSYY